MRCKSCLIPDTRPDTEFVDGECSACINYRKRPEIDWDQRHRELEQLLDRFHGECIVPSSGGKDSTAQVLYMLEMGAHVTVVTARTCHLTTIGRKNIDNLARFARTIEVVPNMTERAELNRIGLDLVGDISLPEHWAIFSTPFRMSVELSIPLIMYGENPQNQYGGPRGTEMAREMTQRWVHEFGGFNGLRPNDLDGFDLHYYTAPTRLGSTEAHFLGAYRPWSSHKNAEKAMQNGFQTLGRPPSLANWWPWENLDNAQTGIHDWFMYLKYGYNRADAQLSVDVRDGRITRDAADLLGNMRRKFPEYYCGVHYGEILDRIGMDPKRFLQLWRQYDAGKKNNPPASLQGHESSEGEAV